MNKLMVLDGTSIVTRAFYGVSSNLTTRTGQPTNAVFGFLNILNKLLDEEQPQALCVTFDRKAPTFRHLAYEGYKAQRKPMPEELASQMPILKEVLSALNIPMYELDGWEADDLIGTISRKCEADGWDCVVVTGDKDSLQLITDHTMVKLVSTRTDLGSEIRRMFIPAEGCVLVDADYSQIELRLLAHMAGDEAMIAAFRSGGDFHAETAAKVFHVAPDQVTHEMRRQAKAVNFGIVYGISGFSLAQDIGVSRKEASDYMEKYLETFSGVRDYMERIKRQAKADGYVSTLMGRRRWLPELKSSNFNLRAFGERVALNMPIQGTAADVMKLAMIRVAARLKAEGLQAQLILQVHDELIVECPQAEEAQVKEILTQEMEGAGSFSVPLIADANAGHSWAEAKG